MLLLYSTLLGLASTALAGFVAVGGAVKPPIVFDGSDVGVNFGGYHASAGLGGILSGGAAGGLHAEAGTPYGQGAAAGLGGVVTKGKTAGALYAGADSGVGNFAGAAVDGAVGDVTSSGTVDGSLAVGGKESYIKGNVEKTYVERTVIPNYVERTVQVPSYVEKTIRVPTVVEKTVRVPAPPTIIEKTVNQPAEVRTDIDKSFYGGIHSYQTGGIYYPRHYYKTGYGGGGATLAVRKSVSPDLINNIFNIPISTLSAVSKLVGGIAGGTSGSFAVSKHVVV